MLIITPNLYNKIYLIEVKYVNEPKTNMVHVYSTLRRFGKTINTSFTLDKMTTVYRLYINIIDKGILEYTIITESTTHIVSMDLNTQETKFTYVLHNNYTNEEQKFISYRQSIQEKVTSTIAEFWKDSAITHDVVFSKFNNREIAFPSQVFINDRDELYIILSTTTTQMFDTICYDCYVYKNNKVIHKTQEYDIGKITDKQVDITTVLSILASKGSTLKNSRLFKLEDDEVVYLAAIQL